MEAHSHISENYGIMIRSIKEHYDLIIASKESKNTLGEFAPEGDSADQFIADVNSGSFTAIWRRLVWVFAVHSWLMDVLFDAHKREIDLALKNQIFGNRQWYKSISLEFQYGYQLEWNGSRYIYTDTTSPAAIDAKIIKRCAVVPNQGQLQLKVAKLTGETPTKLSAPEKDAYFDYMSDLAYPSENIVVISEDADELRFELDVFYDPQVMANDGSLLADPSVFPVKNAVTAYIQDLDFNGTMYESKMIDQVQQAEGVLDYKLNAIEAKYGNLAYAPINRLYVPFAGHMVIDEANTTINYIASS